MNNLNSEQETEWRPLEPGEIIQERDQLQSNPVYVENAKWRDCVDSVGKTQESFPALEFRTRRQKPKKYPACKGTNCGCTDGWSHSPECKVELEEACNPGGIYNEPTPEPQGSAVEWVNSKTRQCQHIAKRVNVIRTSDAIELARRCDAAEVKVVRHEHWIHVLERRLESVRAQRAAAEAKLAAQLETWKQLTASLDEIQAKLILSRSQLIGTETRLSATQDQLAAAQTEAREYRDALNTHFHTRSCDATRKIVSAALAKHQPQTTTPE